MEFHDILVIIHVFIGFLVVYFAIKAFNRSKYVPMLYLALGFSLIVIGDTIIGDLIHFENDEKIIDIIEEIIEISGFMFVIIAVIKS
ncbi:MAG TPA: hypothetical protein VN704_02360 [Verrucomicrobiae bacterium]|nr:hypothetical protein [Verrucomicrobiae bacterium]